MIRPLTADDDLAEYGRIVQASYLELAGHPAEPSYDAELLDVAGRVTHATVIGAADGDQALGCVTYVGDVTSPFAEHLADDEASFRMLGVAAAAQGRGIGAALVGTRVSRPLGATVGAASSSTPATGCTPPTASTAGSASATSPLVNWTCTSTASSCSGSSTTSPGLERDATSVRSDGRGRLACPAVPCAVVWGT